MCKAVMDIKREGERIGEKRGTDKALITAINNLMKNTAKSFEEACEMLGINKTDMKRYKSMI